MSRRWLFGIAGALALGLLLVEAGLRGLVAQGAIGLPAPDDPDFGAWREPLSSSEHRAECFEVTYETNSSGARDEERELASDRPRLVVLGDATIEGFGLPVEDRLSNRMERTTGLEHLNFGMSQFGPYQHYLVYRDLAALFDHGGVIVGILPSSDFFDLESDRAPAFLRALRRHTYTYNALLHGRARSLFYDYTEEQYALLEHALSLLAEEVAGKGLAIVLIPDLTDLLRYDQSGADPLSERLTAWGQQNRTRVINLLPAMHAHTRQWTRYFHECDGHWNAYGNEVATDYVLSGLYAGTFRQR